MQIIISLPEIIWKFPDTNIFPLPNTLFLTHSGILGFITLLPGENANILVFEKSKWIRKQKLTSNIGFFLEFFFQLILATGSQNRSPDIIVYYGIWARVSTKRATALFSDVVHTS